MQIGPMNPKFPVYTKWPQGFPKRDNNCLCKGQTVSPETTWKNGSDGKIQYF